VKIEQRRKLVRVGRSQPLHLASGFIIKGIRFRLCGRLQVMQSFPSGRIILVCALPCGVVVGVKV